MFLDEELIETCKNSKADTPEGVQNLNMVVCRLCEGYYKSKLTANSSDKDVKTVLDRTFGLFDSFVRIANKSEDAKLNILGEMFEKHTFKKQFLQDEKIRKIYESL